MLTGRKRTKRASRRGAVVDWGRGGAGRAMLKMVVDEGLDDSCEEKRMDQERERQP